jgi:hypothetical protein
MKGVVALLPRSHYLPLIGWRNNEAPQILITILEMSRGSQIAPAPFRKRIV